MSSWRLFTTKEVWDRPEWIILDDSVYDFRDFAKRHPGGAGPILAAGGTDVTSVFRSMHKRAKNDLDRYMNILSTYKVGELVSEERGKNMMYDSDFAKELYAEVCAVLPPSKWWANDWFWTRTLCICLLTVIFEAAWIFSGRWEASFLVGVLHAQIGLAVQHDASHGAVSKHWYVNTFLAYGADWIGNSRWLWFQQHIIGHHPNTNDDFRDPDTTSAEPFLLFRTIEWSIRKPFHKFQHWFMYPVLSLYGPSVVFNLPQLATLNHKDEVPVKQNAFYSRQWMLAVLLRVFYWFRTIVLPYTIGNAPLLLALFGVSFVTGFFLTFVFVLSHNFKGSCRFPCKVHDDWFKMQVETSCTYGGTLSGLLTGGLNMQIEHHLFPRMCSIHYPTIAPVVRRVCAKHGVQYTYFATILENIYSTIEFMRLNGLSKLVVD